MLRLGNLRLGLIASGDIATSGVSADTSYSLALDFVNQGYESAEWEDVVYGVPRALDLNFLASEYRALP